MTRTPGDWASASTISIRPSGPTNVPGMVPVTTNALVGMASSRSAHRRGPAGAGSGENPSGAGTRQEGSYTMRRPSGADVLEQVTHERPGIRAAGAKRETVERVPRNRDDSGRSARHVAPKRVLGRRQCGAGVERGARLGTGGTSQSGKSARLGDPPVGVEEQRDDGPDPERAAEKVHQSLLRHVAFVAAGHHNGPRRRPSHCAPRRQLIFKGAARAQAWPSRAGRARSARRLSDAFVGAARWPEQHASSCSR